MPLGDREGTADMTRRMKDYATLKDAAILAQKAAQLEIQQWEARRWHRRLAHRAKQHLRAAGVILRWAHRRLNDRRGT